MGNLDNIDFESTERPEGSGFDPLPEGDYAVMMIASEIKPTKEGNGMYMSTRLQVLEGKYANRLIFHNITIRNNNTLAVQIGHEQLKDLKDAVKLEKVSDSSQFHNIPITVAITCKKGRDGSMENRVARFKPYKMPEYTPATKPSSANPFA